MASRAIWKGSVEVGDLATKPTDLIQALRDSAKAGKGQAKRAAPRRKAG